MLVNRSRQSPPTEWSMKRNGLSRVSSLFYSRQSSSSSSSSKSLLAAWRCHVCHQPIAERLSTVSRSRLCLFQFQFVDNRAGQIANRLHSITCRPSTLEQSTCWRPVCLVTHNISSEAENSFMSAILPRHCVITTSLLGPWGYSYLSINQSINQSKSFQSGLSS